MEFSHKGVGTATGDFALKSKQNNWAKNYKNKIKIQNYLLEFLVYWTPGPVNPTIRSGGSTIRLGPTKDLITSN